MADAIDAQNKWATSRTYKLGSIGDRFKVKDKVYEITSVQRVKLGDVAKLWYRDEGFISPASFRAFYRKLHPRKGFRATEMVYLHHFRAGVIA